jgi:hypothetical protein
MQAVETRVTGERLDQLIRWHGTDETQLPHPDTLKNLSRDTVAALRELEAARETIRQLRAAMGRAFCATNFTRVHAILLDALGPPPDESDGELPPLYSLTAVRAEPQLANGPLSASARS